MLDSVAQFFDTYIDSTSRYTIHSIVMERGENPEDLFYLCEIGDQYYIVFETDYISSIASAIKEATAIFSSDLAPEYVLVKKSYQGKMNVSQIAVSSLDDIEDKCEAIISQRDDSYLRHVIMQCKPLTPQAKRYSPTTYGSTS